MATYQRICLMHYHEIGLKGHNRSAFENRLMKNAEAILDGYPVVTMRRISGRILAFVKEGTPYGSAVEMARVMAGIPGVARVSCGYICHQDLEEMFDAAHQALADAEPFETFKVQARRNHTDFPINSMDLNQQVGAHLCHSFPEKKVRMKEPDVEVHVEVIEGSCYIYAWTIRGVGGLPVGSSGRVMCLLSSGIDSPVAVWRLARRGAIPFGDYQRAIAAQVPPELRIIMYRRLMFKVADALARKVGAKALVTGESLGQVASQTIENISVVNEATELPVFRPFIGTDKIEIIDQAQALGTFDISSQPAPDCCTLFMPRNPETHAKLDRVLEVEQGLPLDEWIPELVASAEPHDYRCPAVNYKKLNRQ